MLAMKMSEGGRVVVPLEIRKSLGLKTGDTVLWDMRPDGGAVFTTRAERMRHAQAMIAQHAKAHGLEHISLSDELIAERRAEAARE